MRSLVLALLGSLALMAARADAAVVTLETDASNVTVGDRFDVRLVFEAGAGEFLTAFLVDLVFGDGASFDSLSFIDLGTGLDQLNLPGGTEQGDGFLTDLGTSVQVFSLSSNTDAQLAAEQAATFTFLTVTLIAEAAGPLDVSLGVLREILGASFGALDVTFAADRVRVNVAPVPLPGAALFLLTGLGLASVRRVATR